MSKNPLTKARFFNMCELYDLYFKHSEYKNYTSMASYFYTKMKKDKDGSRANIDYIKRKKDLETNMWLYSQSDILEYFKNQAKKHNLVLFAKQLIIDLECIYDKFKIEGNRAIISSIVNVKQTTLCYLEFDYLVAKRILDRLFYLFLYLPIEVIDLLKFEIDAIYKEE